MVKVLIIGAAAVLSGCATLSPDSASLVAEHDSHALQHLGAHRTEHGADIMGASVDWRIAPCVTFELREGYSVHGRDGCLDCPRESFSATVRVEVWHK